MAFEDADILASLEARASTSRPRRVSFADAAELIDTTVVPRPAPEIGPRKLASKTCVDASRSTALTSQRVPDLAYASHRITTARRGHGDAAAIALAIRQRVGQRRSDVHPQPSEVDQR